jgi:hypothetical protein
MTLGVLGCSFVFLWTFAFIGYYSSARSFGPSPERGWTVLLPWTYGHYGTFEDNQRMLQFDGWFLPFVLAVFAGTRIRQLHEKDEPWRKRQF